MTSGTVTDLPRGWAWATIGDTGQYVNGVAFKPSDWGDTGPPIIRIQNLTDPNKPLNRTTRLVDPIYKVERGDILVSWSATLDAFLWDREEALLNQHIFKVIPEEQLVRPRFLYYLLRFSIAEIRKSADLHGSTMRHVNRGPFLAFRVRVPPQNEQLRMTAEIENHFTRLDAAVATLGRAQANLKRYRASVLKAACEGRLVPTEAELARAEGRDYEPANALLERILSERRERWEPAPPVANGLPEGWAWATLASVAELKGGITKGQKRKPREALRAVPYLRVANVQRGFLDLSEMKMIEATEDEILELGLEQGDVLFTEGGDRDKLGRGWVWQGELTECIHQNHIFRARLLSRDLQPKFVSWYGNSFGQAYFVAEGKQTTNLASINLTKLKAFPVPIPPSQEQQRIVADVERRLSVVDELERLIERGLKRAERLRQSILKSAFEGKLVPQDPNDEPASVLLKRIRTERVVNADKSSSRVRRSPRGTSRTGAGWKGR